MAAPVQVVINPGNFHVDRELPEGGSPKKDFFASRDAEFAAHRDSIAADLRACAQMLGQQDEAFGGIGYLKVILRREAWAKSHRPVQALFKIGVAPCVGGLDLGEMLFEVTPQALLHIANDVKAAEPETRLKPNKDGRHVPHPSGRRSETGAILKVELFGAADKRRFDIDQAIVWLSQAGTGQSYEVELFAAPPPLPLRDRLDHSHRLLFQSFEQGLASLGQGLNVLRLATTRQEPPRLAIRVERTSLPPSIQLFAAPVDRRVPAPFEPSAPRHAQVLTFLEHHPLVRSIQLPGKIVQSDAQPRERPVAAHLPRRDATRSYAKLGLIDGGVSDFVGDWVIGRWDVLANDDVDASHGTFISGLLIAGSLLNGNDVLTEPDGVEIYDARVFPREAVFPTYYLTLDDFFSEIELAIADARNRHGVRVFNLSMNVVTPVSSDHYSRWASRLDRLAEQHDLVIFISAGNLGDHRPEWPASKEQALAMLASSQNDIILIPAESARNASVGALNPPGMANALAHAPARYSRRGPGLRALVKPDYAHVGGTGLPQAGLGHGLYSITAAGQVADACGTSFASPLVAKTAARLDALVEGGLSRETMLALLTHHARRPHVLSAKILEPVARQLVGHGLPPSAASILEGDDHEITLVFATRLPKDKQLIFPFSWPPSLSQNGNCRGLTRLTLVASPPLDSRFGAEFVRVNLEGALQQWNPTKGEKGGWEGRLKAAYLPASSAAFPIEPERIEHGLKWSPVKVYQANKRGIGGSSNWRLTVKYLARGGETMPPDSVPFTAILTIRDPAASEPVFNEMRQSLATLSVRLEDIRTAAQVVTRV
jgi:hypothetical protein